MDDFSEFLGLKADERERLHLLLEGCSWIGSGEYTCGGNETGAILPELQGAKYCSSVFGANLQQSFFEDALQLPFGRRNKGITRTEGAPRLCTMDGTLRKSLPTFLHRIASVL